MGRGGGGGARRGDAYPPGRKGAESDERRRDETRRDDEGRRGSRTAALNAVPSDRQHRLLRRILGSLRSELSLRSLKLRHARIASSRSLSLSLSLSIFFLTRSLPSSLSLLFSLFSVVSAWRGRGSRDTTTEEKSRVENAGRVRRTASISRVSGGRVCRA